MNIFNVKVKVNTYTNANITTGYRSIISNVTLVYNKSCMACDFSLCRPTNEKSAMLPVIKYD